MGPGAGAGVVIPHPDDPKGFGNAFREFAQVHDSRCLLVGQEFDSDVQMSCNHLVYGRFDLRNLVIVRGFRQEIIAFGLLTFDVRIPRPGAAE